jgi:Polyketide cyclase / dehydrase and lipid transport
MARAAFTQSIHIAAAPDAVKASLADYSHHNVIHPMIVSVQTLDPATTPEGRPLRRYNITDRVRMGPFTFGITYLATISEAADGALVSAAYQQPRVHLHNVTHCLPEGDGTHVEEQIDIEAPGLLIGYVLKQARQAHSRMLANLKTMPESGAHTVK